MVLAKSRLATALSLLGSVALWAAQSDTAVAQQAKADRCAVRKEPSGLIRGDRIPSGCLLQNEEPPVSREPSDWPAIVCEETIFHTPLPKKSVLTNCVALSRGRMLIPTVPPSNGKLGPIERELGHLQRHFGPLDRHFGPIQRSFGPVDRDSRRR